MEILKKETNKYPLPEKWIVMFLAVVVALFISGCIIYTIDSYWRVPEKQIVTTTTVKQICSREDDWKQLKSIDDEGLVAAADGFEIAGNIFTAYDNQDAQAVVKYTNDLRNKATEVQGISSRRQTVLRRLGY